MSAQSHDSVPPAPAWMREDGVVAVELAAEETGELELVELRDQRGDRLVEFAAVAFLLGAGGGLDQLHHDRGIVELPLEGHESGDRLLQAVELGDVLLGALGVVPERRGAHLGLHGLDLALLLFDVKETSTGGRRAS